MTYIEQPNAEGQTKDCPNCGKPIVARLKEYKDYPNKIQWQDKDQTKAHYDKDGNCKTTETPPEQTTIPESSTPKQESTLNLLDDVTKKLIKNEAILLWHVRNHVEDTIKGFEEDPHGGMIGQFTELIWKKYFGEKE